MTDLEKPIKAMPDLALINRVEWWASSLVKTAESSWTLSLPPDANQDPDLLIRELIERYTYWSQKPEEVNIHSEFQEIRKYKFDCMKCETTLQGSPAYNSYNARHTCPTCGTTYEIDTWIRQVRRAKLEYIQLKLEL